MFVLYEELKFYSFVSDALKMLKYKREMYSWQTHYCTGESKIVFFSSTRQFILLFRPVLLNIASSTTPHNDHSHLKRISSVLETEGSSTSSAGRSGPTPPNSLPQLIKRNSTGSLNNSLVLQNTEPSIVHAGAVVSILHLVPAIKCLDNTQVFFLLQYLFTQKITFLNRECAFFNHQYNYFTYCYKAIHFDGFI